MVTLAEELYELGDVFAQTLPAGVTAVAVFELPDAVWVCCGISDTVSTCDSSPPAMPSLNWAFALMGVLPCRLGRAKVVVPSPP
ncbi:hypothetical protein ACFO1S_26450 [Cohnella boryungensis]|uniref:Uncharacterized protein n=1 Tax=Cohnella boryungensis TaxID=768479 RepID=A0ABV8SHM9_9BACL